MDLFLFSPKITMADGLRQFQLGSRVMKNTYLFTCPLRFLYRDYHLGF